LGRVGVIAALLGLLGGVVTPAGPSPSLTLRGRVVVDVCTALS